MDWKHNQWFGLGAAVLLVGAIIWLFMWTTSPPSSTLDIKGPSFQCESTQKFFVVPISEIQNNTETYSTYFDSTEAVLCRVCGQKDAYHMFFCKDPECNKWYKWGQAISVSTLARCPKGHEIDTAEYP